MAVLHAALAWLVVASVVGVVVTAGATASGLARSYRALDAALLVQAGVTALAGLAGAATFAVYGAPSDPLHLLYGAIVGGAPLGVRIAAQGRTARSLGRWVLAAALVAIGAVVRSFMTGR